MAGWHVGALPDKCPSDKPYAVIKDGNGGCVGCYPTKGAADAKVQQLFAGSAGISDDASGSFADGDQPDKSFIGDEPSGVRYGPILYEDPITTDLPGTYPASVGGVSMPWQAPAVAYTTPTTQIW